MKTLRLILGDQLNHKHSWFDKTDDEVIYFMAEMRQETDYVKHHIQKVIAYFSAMRNFADHLKQKNHHIIYYQIDAEDNTQDLAKNLNQLIDEHKIEKFEYQFPDEYRLDEQLKDFCQKTDIETDAIDTEHFYTTRTEMAEFYKGKKEMTMEYFYRAMRKKHGILMQNGKNPEGGDWNFDKSNRKKWTGKPEIPHEKGFRKDVSNIVKQIEDQNINTIGSVEKNNFNWPTSREDCLKVLNYFCKNLLIHFGDYQDALHTNERFLFHSRLSFAMNSKMLSPREVVDKVTDTFYRNDDIDISQTEGFIRQVLGWREYMRGIYWMKMPGYRRRNKLDNQNSLPDFFWTGDTHMNCLHHSITQSLEEAYAHHIERLMVTGNFALLTQVHPDEVDAWYLGIYIDALEWVEMPNTRGMSQYADGGIVATKPYVSSGSYINKMSNYCSDCKYDVNKKNGEDDACPFNSLYWNFLEEKKEHFKHNQRMNMMMSVLKKMGNDKLENHQKRAHDLIKNPDSF